MHDIQTRKGYQYLTGGEHKRTSRIMPPNAGIKLRLPIGNNPLVRVKRVNGVEPLLVVLQDIFEELGGISKPNARRSIESARQRLGRDVDIHRVQQGPNTVLACTLNDALDLLIEMDVPDARQLRRQLIELGKAVKAGDEDGAVEAEIASSKATLDALPVEEKKLMLELLQPAKVTDAFAVVESRG